MTTRTVHTLAELDTFAQEMLSTLSQKDSAHVIALTGDLGVGKTSFTQALAKHLDIAEHVVSPTFMIMRSYQTENPNFKKLVHIDAYRVEDIREMEVLKIPELFSEAGTVICIEWPERIAALIPQDAHRITFAVNSDDSRTITYGNS